MGGGGGGKGKSNYKNPVQITTSVQGAFIAAVKGFAGVGDPKGGDLAIDQFMESVHLEGETSSQSNIGHPLFRPFTLRRFGYDTGLPENNKLAYDNVSGKYLAYCQLEEGMRIYISGGYTLLDDFNIAVGDTIYIEDITMGVRRLFLVEGMSESESGIELNILDVLGG